jgi:hypothetical protein
MKRLIAPIVAALALALGGTAIANVLIYQNGFGKKKDFERIERLQGGKKCKSFRKGGRALGLRVNTGSHECLFQTPVEGDAKRPDYTIQAAAKVQKKTNKKVRDKVYVGLAARANRKSAYEIRIFPKGRTFQLLKSGDEVAADKNRAINPLDKRNLIRLHVDGGTVIATVNGERLARFDDQSPREVTGRKTAIGFGSVAKANKDGFGVVDSLKVFVPTP